MLHLINTVGNMIPHKARRFILDQVGAGRYLARAAAGKVESIQLPNGLFLYFNPLMHWNVASPDAHEPRVMRILHEHLRPGSVFYDVGANVGLYSLKACSLVAYTGKVLAFEPSESNLTYLRRSLAQENASDITLHPIALGAEDGVMTFDDRGVMSGRLIENGEKPVAPVKVEVRSIDSLVNYGHPAPDVIKIDVEGGEGAVLEGAAQTLAKHRPVIICEMHPDNPDGIRRAFSALAVRRAKTTVCRLAKRRPPRLASPNAPSSAPSAAARRSRTTFSTRSKALEIEARAERRLADEYDAAQERGEVARAGDNQHNREVVPNVNDLGLSRKEIHEARMIRDA